MLKTITTLTFRRSLTTESKRSKFTKGQLGRTPIPSIIPVDSVALSSAYTQESNSLGKEYLSEQLNVSDDSHRSQGLQYDPSPPDSFKTYRQRYRGFDDKPTRLLTLSEILRARLHHQKEILAFIVTMTPHVAVSRPHEAFTETNYRLIRLWNKLVKSDRQKLYLMSSEMVKYQCTRSASASVKYHLKRTQGEYILFLRETKSPLACVLKTIQDALLYERCFKIWVNSLAEVSSSRAASKKMTRRMNRQIADEFLCMMKRLGKRDKLTLAEVLSGVIEKQQDTTI